MLRSRHLILPVGFLAGIADVPPTLSETRPILRHEHVSSWTTIVATISAPVAARHPGWPTILVPLSPTARPAHNKPQPAGPRLPVSHALEGIASYYWQGDKTASGEAYDKTQLTAAHRTLPFNSRVRVTNALNGRAVIVRINDRGPFKPDRVIDLSEAAADAIGMRRQGLVPVRVDVLASGTP